MSNLIDPALTVLTSVYNCDKYIGECIESVINQTFENFEFIIIDDGSTDNTSKIIQSYVDKDRRIKFYKKLNSGLTNSLNYGINLSNSNYILRIDADDKMFANRIEIVFDLIKTKNVDIVVNRSLLIDSNGSKIKKSKKLNKDQLKKCLLNGFSPFSHSSVIFKKDKIIELGKYNSFYEKSQDYDLWLRMIKNNSKFYFYNQTLTYLRIHNESLTNLELDFYSMISLFNYWLFIDFNQSLSNEELVSNKSFLVKWINNNYLYKNFFVKQNFQYSKNSFIRKMHNYLKPKIYYIVYLNFKKNAKRINPNKFI